MTKITQAHGAEYGAPGRAGRPAAPYTPASPGTYGAAAYGAPGGAHPSAHPTGAEYGAPYDAQTVIARLEEAGTTLLALPRAGYSTAIRTTQLDFVRDAAESYGWSNAQARPPAPSPAAITRMDEALTWLSRIPQDRYVLRRIVGARSLINPNTQRHLFPWRRIGTMIGADHKAIQRWHSQGIDLIVAALRVGR